MIEDPYLLSDMFGNFFANKVKEYSHLPSNLIDNPQPTIPISFSKDEVLRVLKDFKGKKCFGIDNIPQVLLKDAFLSLSDPIIKTFNCFAAKGLPSIL